MYSTIFSEDNFKSLEDIYSDPSSSFDFDSTKIKKIKYTINLMLQSGMYIRENPTGPSEVFNSEISLMELMAKTEELEMFDTDTVQNLVEYKWTMYGRQHHFLGMAMHMFYTFMLTVYVCEAYLKETAY
jgi:hypothetical protein